MNLNEYNIIMRTYIDNGRQCYDINSELGEWHEVYNNDNKVLVHSEYNLNININKSDQIIKFITNINKENTESEETSNIDYITLIRPNVMNGFFTSNNCTYFKEDITNTTDCKCDIQKGLHCISFDFIQK